MNAWKLLGIAAVPALSWVGSASAQERVTFEIAPQPLESALVAFATQAHVSIALPPRGLEPRSSAGLHGAHSKEEALGLLLRDSGLRYERINETTYRIVVIAREAPPASVTRAPVETADVIVVSARRPTALGNLPRAATHVGAERLAEAGAVSDSALATEISGLSFTNVGDGRNKIILRGVSDGALTGRAQSLVGLYLDDTRLTYAAPDPDLQLIDIASVDVLRGPQGALYGAGAIGGIMRLESHPVELDAWSSSALASVEATSGGGVGRNVEVVLNAPILKDRLGVRAVYYDQDIAGWLDNSGLGHRDANAVRRRGARLRALARLTPHWSLDLTGVTQAIDSADSQYLSVTSTGLQRDAALLEPHDNDFDMVAATVRGRTRWGDVTSSTSYLHHDIASRFDATNAFANLGAPAALTRPIDEQDALSMLIHETRLTAPQGARLPWFVGLFLADGDNSRDVLLRDGAFGAWSLTDYREHRVDSIDEAALFGEMTWRLTPTVALGTGLRLFRSTLSTRSTTTAYLLDASGVFSGDFVDTGAAPDLRLSWQPSPNALFFLSAAEGYRSGGFNTGGAPGTPFSTTNQPFRRYAGDEIWTYELGARLRLLRGSVDISATVFANDWRDVQTDALVASNFVYTGNAGQARAIGFEFDTRYAPTDRLVFRVHGLINEPEISGATASFSQATTGGLPGAPEFSGSASARYTHPLDGWRANIAAFAEIDMAITGKSTLGFGQGAPIGDYTETKARLGLNANGWDGSIYMENVANSDGATFSYGNPYQDGRTLLTPLRPRSIGLTLRKHF